MTPTPKILVLIDFPRLATGFAKVGNNVLSHWTGVELHLWAIGYEGIGYESCPRWKLFPSGQWNAPGRLDAFLRQLATGGYTHVFLLQDTFQFGPRFCEAFRNICSQRHIRSVMYFPVDAPLEKEWTEILGSVDVCVAYTEYGRAEALKKAAMAELRLNCHVLPHGVDRDIYQPRADQRAEDRTMWRVLGQAKAGGKPVEGVFVRPDDFVLLNVNTNQRRKDPARSLEMLAGLIDRGVPAKLIMHCRGATPYGVDLEAVGRQFGLQLYRDWVHAGDLFGPGDTTYLGDDLSGRPLIGSRVNEQDMARFYNAADCLLSTSLGEGWGLSLTEALACGCPVALPLHTGCKEIASQVTAFDAQYAGVMLCPLPAGDVLVPSDEMSRVRYRVEMPAALDRLEDYYRSNVWRERRALPAPVAEWLSWPRIAGEMLRLLLGEATVRPAEKTVDVTLV